MERRLIFSNNLKDKLNAVSAGTRAVWAKYAITDIDYLMKKIVDMLNGKYNKLNITKYLFRDDVSVYGESSTYFGLITRVDDDGTEIIEAYAFMVPPSYATRSGVLAQQVFPVLSGMMKSFDKSNDYKISNRPIYIINANEENHTPAMAVNYKSGEILGFQYIDVFNRSIDKILCDNGLMSNIVTIKQYDELLTQLNKSRKNEFFKLDEVSKTIKFLVVRIKDGIHVNNEPYWFVLKAYTAVYLALQEDYQFDMSEINTLARGNKTLDSFRDYVEKLK